MKKTIAILMAALMALALIACDMQVVSEPEATPEPTAEPKTVVGTWVVKEIKVGTKILSLEEIVKYGLDVNLVLNADGTGVLTLPTSYPDFRADVTYTETAATYMGTEIPYTFDGDTISVNYPMNGVTFSIVLKRA